VKTETIAPEPIHYKLLRKGVEDLAALCCEGVGIEKETEWLTLGSCRMRNRVTIDQ